MKRNVFAAASLALLAACATPNDIPKTTAEAPCGVSNATDDAIDGPFAELSVTNEVTGETCQTTVPVTITLAP